MPTLSHLMSPPFNWKIRRVVTHTCMRPTPTCWALRLRMTHTRRGASAMWTALPYGHVSVPRVVSKDVQGVWADAVDALEYI